MSAGEGRIVCRYSSGCPSAVASKLAIAEYGADRVYIVKSDTRSEHADNERFDREVSEWLGKEITYLASDEYQDIWHVFEKERFIVSHQGAKCRSVLKMVPFYDFWLPSDTLIFGYTADKRDAARADRLRANSAEKMAFPLIERNLTKGDCKAIIERAGIEIPMMYRLGFQNNNCRGCPKGGMGYWNLIRENFPEDFERMSAIQRELGPGSGFLVRRGERITLDQLLPEDGKHDDDLEFECSIMCALAEQEIAA
jgi:3'-phosphoadenosine 5'-phosphosulfate sulfotransferase (PAPS reductase)/FAD synthetase